MFIRRNFTIFATAMISAFVFLMLHTQTSYVSAAEREEESSVQSDGIPGRTVTLGGVGEHQCGNLSKPEDNFKTKFDFGCIGADGPSGMNPIEDLIYAFIRFLSVGVGIVIIIALIMAGIQYSASEGNPEASAKAKKRAQNALIGLLVYMFAWAILQFIIPGGVFK